ncbi:Histone-Lysine N-Methyltransferase ash1l [Linnemannia zychae]|nr:Histone-Lysine N-Methyltransferase ash1l [Linnemannia zychae]
MAIKSKKRKLTAGGRSAVEARSATSQEEAELEREEEEMLAMTRLLKQVDENEAVLVTKKLIMEASGNSDTLDIAAGDAEANENSKKQDDTQRIDHQDKLQDQDRDSIPSQQDPIIPPINEATAADDSGEPVAKRIGLRASARKNAHAQEIQNGVSADAGLSRHARGDSSTRSEVSDTHSTGSISSLASSLPIIFKPDEAEGSASAIVSGFEMPIRDLTQPRLSQALISRKARTIYAPETAKALSGSAGSTEPVKRRPGRPPGYFLGPTSCAFCRQQHRRCDYNTVCHRCIKAKIPCDRTGTVERPSIIVREARIQAKAEAAAVLELAVAAGYAEHPDPKLFLKPRPRSLRASTRKQSLDHGSPEPSSTGSSMTVRESVKRKRSPSPSSISRDNIIQQRVKRVAASRDVKVVDSNSPAKSKEGVSNKPLSPQPRTSNNANSDDSQPEIFENDHIVLSDTPQSTQADNAASKDSNSAPVTSTASTSSSTELQLKTKEPTNNNTSTSTSSSSTTPVTTVQRAYKSAAELARIAPPNALQKPRVRVRVAKAPDTTGKRKAGRPPGGKFIPTAAHLTPANQAILIRAQSVTNPQAVEPETMRLMMMLKRRPGRPPWKHTLPQPDPVVKRPVGRPTNAERFALNPSLIPPPKALDLAKRGPGRPIRAPNAVNTPTSPSTPAKPVSPTQPSKPSVSKPTPAPSKTVVPAKRSHAAASSNQTQALVSANAVSKGKSVTSRAMDTADDDTESNKSEPIKSNVRVVKKIYLKSGLYSSDLKVNPSESLAKNGSKSSSTSRAIVSSRQRAKAESAAASLQKSSFFELPINYGATLMSKQRDFRLPFDIMQASQLGLLRKTPQPEPFIKIRSNIFVERKRRTETSPMVCHCKPPRPEQGRIGCGDDCYNRVMFYECVSAHCPCGDLCSNQRFQKKHNEDHLRVIWTQERGFGIQTTAPIKKGNLVIEYRGEVISQAECHKRMEGIYKNNKNFYFLEYEKGEVVDACQKGTNARFVNHSCSPNSQIEKWFLNGEMSIGIFAAQDIPAGAEISYDYNFSSFSGAQKQRCRCGSVNCRGYIGERISKNKEASSAKDVSGQSGSKANAKKRKTRRRGTSEQESSSLRMGQMPNVGFIRQRQSDKYKEGKMAAIRYTRLFLFRNIRLVESKYVKYAQTKSRSFQERVSPAWLAQARQCRKRSLEGVIEDLRKSALEQAAAEEEDHLTDDLEQTGSSIAGDDASDFLPSASIIEIQETDQEDEVDHDDNVDASSHYDLSEDQSRSPSHGDHQPSSEDADGEVYERYENNAVNGDKYSNAEQNGGYNEDMENDMVDQANSFDDNYDVGANMAVENEVKKTSLSAALELKSGGINANNRSVSAESLGSTVVAEQSPGSIQESIDTDIEDVKMGELEAPKVNGNLIKNKKEYGSRRLRSLNH